MKLEELSDKQHKTLRAIYDLTVQNGMSPTLSQLRQYLDLKSGKSVLEGLSILERKGYITREAGKSRNRARGLRLTPDAYVTLSLSPSLFPDSIRPLKPEPFELNPDQKKISEFLSSHDPILGRIYRGARQTIDARAEDWIAQSAHSLREIMTSFLRKSNLNDGVKSHITKRKKEGNPPAAVIGTQYYFDELGGADGETAYDIWYKKYQKHLHDIAHHQNDGKKYADSPDKYLDLVSEFEGFLLRAIVPKQIDVYKELDRIITDKPENNNPDELRPLVTRNAESQRYFFSKVGTEWFYFLRDNNFLSPSWVVGNYLSRIVPDLSKEVVDVILSADVEDDWNIKNAYVIAAAKALPEDAARVVKKVRDERWLGEIKGGLLPHYLSDLLKNLIQGERFLEALDLTDLLLEVGGTGPYGRSTSTAVDEYYYAEILKEIAKIKPEALESFIRLIAKKLEFLGEYVGSIYPPLGSGKEKDYTVEDMLISSLMAILPKYIEYQSQTDQSTPCNLISRLFGSSSFEIAKRLRIYTYTLNPNWFLPCIEANLVRDFEDERVWGELSLLLQKVFPNLEETSQDKYLELLDKGPKLSKKDDEYKKHWQKFRLKPVKGFISESKKKKYAELLVNLDETEDPVFRKGVITSWYGPESPVSGEELEKMTPDEVIKFLTEWKPPADQFFGPSRSGLGLPFRNVVKNKATEYSAHAALFLSKDLRPTYVYHFVSGLDEAVKNKIELDWDSIISFCKEIIHRAQSGTLPIFDEEGGEKTEAVWRDVFQEIARLINHALDEVSYKFDYKYKVTVWAIISYLCEDPDPTPEREKKYGGDNSDPYTMSINSTRGDAFHALFAYIFWCNRHENSSERFIPEEVKKILIEHLDSSKDPSLTIRSVYGRFLPWLFMYDQDWSKDLLKAVFPKDDIQLRYAAWETYLTNSVFSEVYVALRAEYEEAIKDLGSGIPKRKYWVDPIERLAEHIMIAYAFEVDNDTNPLYEHFFSNAKGKYRGMAVSFGGRAFVNRTPGPNAEKAPRMEMLKKFWQWRLKETTSLVELKNFGWWVKKDKFENKWMLDRLLETVEKTEGELEGDHFVLQALAQLSAEHPLVVARILNLIVRSVGVRRHQTIHVYLDEIKEALLQIYKSNKKDARLIADKIIEYLTKLGFEDLRHIPDLARSAKKI